jgi:hypothetical protein
MWYVNVGRVYQSNRVSVRAHVDVQMCTGYTACEGMSAWESVCSCLWIKVIIFALTQIDTLCFFHFFGPTWTYQARDLQFFKFQIPARNYYFSYKL